VSSVYAGQRVKLIGFSEELTTAGPVFLITKTDYDQESDTVTMQLDKPMGFTTFFVQMDYRRS